MTKITAKQVGMYAFLLLICVIMFSLGYSHRQYVEAQEHQVKELKKFHEADELRIQTLEDQLKACKKAQTQDK